MQAERDSLAGLSEVQISQAPHLIPNVGGWLGEPDQASELPPQQPGLTHLRRRLGLPSQQSIHQAAAPQQVGDDEGMQQGGAAIDPSSQALQRFANCTYEVSQRH